MLKNILRKLTFCIFLTSLTLFLHVGISSASSDDILDKSRENTILEEVDEKSTSKLKVINSMKSGVTEEKAENSYGKEFKEFKFGSRRDRAFRKVRKEKMEEYKAMLDVPNRYRYNYLEKGIMEYPYTQQGYDVPLMRNKDITEDNIYGNTNGSEIAQKTGKAARVKTKKVGLSRATARFTDPKVLKDPKLYGPYLSAMLADENLQEMIGNREEEILMAMGQRQIERDLLNAKYNIFNAKSIKAQKAAIHERRNQEKSLYGRVLEPAENPNATFRERLIDMEARRRLRIKDWDTMLETIDNRSPSEIDKLLREKVNVHPYVFKYRSPEYREEYIAERSPEEIIHLDDLQPQLKDEEILEYDDRNLQREYMSRYRDFTLDNLIHYGPTLEEILNCFYIIGFIRFCFMSLKYNPKVGFIIACSGIISAYAYKGMLLRIISTGVNGVPGSPNLFRLGMNAADINTFYQYLTEGDERKFILQFKFKDIYDIQPETPLYFAIKNNLFWLKSKADPAIQSSILYFNEKIARGSFTFQGMVRSILNVINYIPNQIRGLCLTYDNLLQTAENTLFLQQILRGGRKYTPYPIYWHWGTCFVINSFFIDKWENYLGKIDLYITQKLVPEMRYMDILRAEYIRTYLLISAVYAIMLAMLHALFNQYYYLPFVSEMVDMFFGKRSAFKKESFLTRDKRFRGGDLSWQEQWEPWEAKRGDFKLWYGLLGKPRKYKLPKWMRIFNPIWWLKRLKRK